MEPKETIRGVSQWNAIKGRSNSSTASRQGMTSLEQRQLSDACLAVCDSHSSIQLQSGATLVAHRRCRCPGLRVGLVRSTEWGEERTYLKKFEPSLPLSRQDGSHDRAKKTVSRTETGRKEGGDETTYLASRDDATCEERMSVETAADLQTTQSTSATA